jgi:cellulose synthase/poly-beta-1,6-N-acetylglucosamine synthase-like glycosyltransferase
MESSTFILENILRDVYNISLFPLIFLSVFFYFLSIYGIFSKSRGKNSNSRHFPFVTIQIPVYNDPVVARCIDACLKLDYPKNRYEIIVADDSDDPKTREIIDKYKNKVTIIRRGNREGFKAGALNNALKYSTGDIIVVFDSDSIPPRNFLKKIVAPFEDKNVALVQAKQTYINKNLNIISKFAAVLQSIYYNFTQKLNSTLNLTFCSGSAVAIRRDVLERFKWNEESVTEDADISLKIFASGYKTVYLDNVTSKSEVPYNIIHFLKQQARWTFGITRAFIDNFKLIISSKNLNYIRKFYLILYFSLYNFLFFLVAFTFSGLALLLIGEPRPFTFSDFVEFSKTLVLTSGYLFLFFVASRKEKINVREILSPILIGLINSINNLVFYMRAFVSKRFHWYKTPKWGNLFVE